MPYIPYGWQDKSGAEDFKASKSKRLNVLGLLNRNNEERILYLRKQNNQ